MAMISNRTKCISFQHRRKNGCAGMTFNQLDTDDESTENDRLLSKKTRKQRQSPKSQRNPESPNKDASKWERITSAIRKRLKKDGLRMVLLIILNGFYLYFGGVVFYLLETKPKFVVDKRKHVEMLFNTFKSLHLTADHMMMNISNISTHDVNKISSVLQNIHSEFSESESESWTVTNAVFFASTVVTTIGYGNMAPVTTGGRWFCVFYAIVGVPLTVMLLALVGKIISKYINHLCNFIVKTLREYLYSKYEYEQVDEGTELRAPVWLALLFMLLVTSIFALMFMKMEQWSFSKSLYFIFITFTTIGFGDIVPHNDNAIWFNVTFLYIGLAALSITINLLIANITHQYRKHKQKIKIVQKIEEELEDSDEETLPADENGDVTEMADFTNGGNGGGKVAGDSLRRLSNTPVDNNSNNNENNNDKNLQNFGDGL
eukprot:TCONS_00025146-protein